MAPLSCKFVLFFIVLSKSNEVISDWLGLNNLFAIFQVHGYEKSSQLLPKTIKNWANLHEMGGHYIVATLYKHGTLITLKVGKTEFGFLDFCSWQNQSHSTIARFP